MQTEKEFHYNQMNTGQLKKHREIWEKVVKRMPDHSLAKREYDLLTKILYKRIGRSVQ